jgi:hypothetical protein
MFNSMPMLVMCAAAMLIVILQPLIFFKMSWKRARDLGILPENLRGVVKSSALFSIVPTLPLLINYLVLMPAFGKFFAWLRLSVMGNAAYETTIADMVASSLGFENIYAKGIDITTFVLMCFAVTIAIQGGALFTMCFTKFYEKKVRQATSKVGGGKMVGLVTTAMFVGMYSTIAARHLTNTARPLNLVAFLVSAAVTMVCTAVGKKAKWLKQFTFSLSIVAGMLSASVITLFL